jgi:prepilin-type N-terminal cleavage/methylation domain-containing protein
LIRYFIINHKGITLVELVVVLAILAITTALVTIGPGFVSADRIRSASRELLSDLQWLRHSAMTQGPDFAAPQLRGFGIRLETKNRYRLFRFNDNNGNSMYDGPAEESPLSSGEPAAKLRDISLPIELKINSGGTLADPGNHVLIFDHLGIPRQPNLGFQQASFVIQNPDLHEIQKKCISVTFNRIREGVWYGNSCKEQ